MSDADNTRLCANCGHMEYHHRPECEFITYWSSGERADCLCPAFVEQSDKTK